MAKLFRGDDRRAIDKVIDVLDWIRRRDAKALSEKKTAALSTRTPIFDQSYPLLAYAVNAIESRLFNLVLAEQNVAIPASDMPQGKRNLMEAGALYLIAALKSSTTRPETSVELVGVSDVTLTYSFSTIMPGHEDLAMSHVYVWDELVSPMKTFKQKAVEDWDAPDVAIFFS